MAPIDLRDKLRGVIAFPVTPFHADLSLDLGGLRKNLRALLAHPICAIVAGAGTGELYSLSPKEHLAVVQTTLDEVKNKMPVLAGVGFNPAIAAEAAGYAAASVRAASSRSRRIIPAPTTTASLAYYRAIGKATSLGLLIYSRDWFNPSANLVKRLADEIPTLIAWKDGQADLRRYQMIQEKLGRRLLWIGGAGDDMVPGYYSIGCRTYTSSIANVAPEAVVVFTRIGMQRPFGGIDEADDGVSRADVRAARQAKGIRGLGDEGDDGNGRPRRRPGPPAAGRSARRGSSDGARLAAAMEGVDRIAGALLSYFPVFPA